MTSTARESLSVLIMVRNEADNLEALLPDVARVLHEAGYAHEVIVVDAASSDGSEAVARRHGAKVIQQTHPGYANALRQGLAACAGDAILTLDADMSHRPLFMIDLLAQRHRAGIVIASRYVEGGGADMPMTRLVLSRILNTMFGRLLGIEVRDMSSGFRLYDRGLVQSLEPRGEHFDVLPEIVVLALAGGHRAIEVPFHYHPRDAGVSKARALAFSPSYARTLARCMAARWRGRRGSTEITEPQRSQSRKSQKPL